MIEKLYEHVSNLAYSQVSPQWLMTIETQKVVGIHHGKIGMYLMNQSRQHLHYKEEALKLNVLTHRASRLDMIHSQIFSTHGHHYHFWKDGQNCFLNRSDWNRRVAEMHLPDLAYCILFPGGTKVPKIGKHGNCGISVGWTCCQSISKKSSDTAELQLTMMDGTLSLASMFVKTATLIREMTAHAHFEQPFTDMSGCFQDHSKYAQNKTPREYH
jgi:hypothetical protein